MKKIILAGLISVVAAGSAMAQSCETKAVGKDGKPMTGVEKSKFIRTCEADARKKAKGATVKPCDGMSKDGKC